MSIGALIMMEGPVTVVSSPAAAVIDIPHVSWKAIGDRVPAMAVCHSWRCVLLVMLQPAARSHR